MNASLAARPDYVTAPLAASLTPATRSTANRGESLLCETELPAALLWPPGRVLGYRYRIDRLLEIGGMATVYEGTQLDLVRRVAIKVLTAECAEDSPRARRFEREARTLAGLQHPHIVSVFELGRSEEGVAFMAMELVEGPTLREHLMAARTLPWRVATEITAQLADALEFAHASGVVHGDVSAANVLLTRRGDIFVSKLIDFGAARRISDGDLPHLTCGTTRYIAPELFSGQAPHIPSDLFALGAVLKEMLGEATLAASPPLLQQLVASMLDADPRHRPGSAAKVALRLRNVLDCQPAIAPRVRRGWMEAGLIGGAALCVLAAYVHYRTPAGPTRIRAAAAPQIVRAAVVTAQEESRIAPPPRVEPVSLRSQLAVAPHALVEPQRDTGLVPVAVPEAVPASVEETADNQQLRGESIARVEIVASLDRWLNARNQDVAGERVGEPSIVFDPTGTSASVRYRKRLLYPNPNGVVQSIVEEQVFFAKLGEAWQIVNPDSG